MRISTIDSVTTSPLSENDLFRIEQRPSVSSAIVFLMVLIPALVAILFPVVAIGSLAISDLGTRGILIEKSGSSVLVVLGIGLLTAMWGIPAFRFLGQLGAKRVIEIEDGCVGVQDRTLFGRNNWSCALKDFDGLAHNVRTTMSGSRQELVLVHATGAKSVLVHMAPLISEAETLKFSQFLTQQMMSEFSSSHRGFGPAPAVNGHSQSELEGLAA